mmetsp:Transcript_102025/g.288060  ORF Transcript_102025/g.288060 Transcript_102025/m.288060 type:complete len:224 (+) Transcript_102025:78-749(+)
MRSLVTFGGWQKDTIWRRKDRRGPQKDKEAGAVGAKNSLLNPGATAWPWGGGCGAQGGDVSAAAAAAIAKPAKVDEVGKDPEQRQPEMSKEELSASIHQAQFAAVAKRSMAMLDQVQIADAQIQAAMARRPEQEPLAPDAFIGNWVDAMGNLVNIYSADAWQVRLLATISRPARPDVHLSVRQDPDWGWICGNSALVNEFSSSQELHWRTFEGYDSVWYRGKK